ncbi:hypothetical protein AXF42_Ash000195 [Apostasia shenzhenica]|uniref:Uncharacterized protein n=1 Tax=Apostasia shenzhenica TaxID=1088818 RepID=A0A2I0AFP1_9ASPA|nr:hypothetical protein AXF42_Ash000195 [Apostasia shenzhenica]
MNPSTRSTAVSSPSSSWLSGIVGNRSTKPTASGTGGGAGSSGGDVLSLTHRKNQLRGVLFKYGPKSIQRWLLELAISTNRSFFLVD